MDTVFVGFGVVYKLFEAMMGRTFQKFIRNSHFVEKIIVSIALTISIFCLYVGKKIRKFQ